MAGGLDELTAWRVLEGLLLVLLSVFYVLSQTISFVHVRLHRALAAVEDVILHRKQRTIPEPLHPLEERIGMMSPRHEVATSRGQAGLTNEGTTSSIEGRGHQHLEGVFHPSGDVKPLEVEGISSRFPRRSIEAPYNCSLGSNKRNKYYAVARGRVPDIYLTWPEAKAQVHEYSGAHHKSFKSFDEAQAWLHREFRAMGLQWRMSDTVTGHRQNVNYLGQDEHRHAVFRCRCCSEIYYQNDS